MLNADILTFREFAMHEALPLSRIQQAVLEFLQGRSDVVLFGAQAVNAYVDEPRMTQDVDLLSLSALEFAEELRKFLGDKFHIAVRTRKIGEKGCRIYQVRNEGNRHLVDVRSIDELPDITVIEKIQVLTPVELIASKVVSYYSRKGKPKAGTDWRDLGELLLKFPELKKAGGDISRILSLHVNGAQLTAVWNELVEQNFSYDDDDDLSYL